MVYFTAGNDIRVIEDNAFSVARFWDDRVERRLVMSACNLRHVSATAFRSLPRLRSLRLADNPLLPRTDVLAAVRRVDDLSKLDVSSGAVFRRSHDLAELFLHDSAAGLRLEELAAAGNGIRTIGVNISTAAVVDSLRSLDLADNELTTLRGGLSQLRRLERLSVKGNRLRVIGRGALTALDRLVTLDASYNELEKFDDGALRPLRRLRHLNLAANRLRTLSATVVPPGLEFLSVRDNRLASVGFLASLGHLRLIDVSGNGIVRLGARLFSGRRVRSPISANFSRCELSSIDGRAFADVAFSVLDLAGNRLTRLSLYGANASDVLRADDNAICDVDDQVFHATRDLHIANNRLSSLRCDNSTAVNLDPSSSSPTELAPSHTATHAETATQSTSSSQVLVLDVSGNPNLGPSFSSCHSLVELDRLEVLRAQRIRLRRLPVSLVDRLTSLRVLDLAENEIDAIPDNAAAVAARLRDLDLSDNRLENISMLAESVSWNAERRSAVNVAGNPWQCLCGDVDACRRLTSVFDTETRHLRRPTPRCNSPHSSRQSVLEFCRELISASDKNRTTLGCLNGRKFEQRDAEETATFRTLSMISIAFVMLSLSASLACCRHCRRNTRRSGRRRPGSSRRNGYRIVGETALDFTDVQ